jgi:DNA-binding NtrC family response regulator
MHNVDQIRADHLPREIWGEAPQSKVPFSYEIPPEGIVLDDVVGQVEKDLVSKAFQITGGNVAKTARILNVPRGTLRYKLEKYELSSD